MNKLRRSITSITAAAAALLAQHPVLAAHGQPISRLLGNSQAPTAQIQAVDDRSTKRPAQIILKPSAGRATIQFAGHRSHSSHRSHRSHSSHVSSSFAPYDSSPPQSAPVPTTPKYSFSRENDTPARHRDEGRPIPGPRRDEVIEDPTTPLQVQSLRPAAAPQRVVPTPPPKPVIDLKDPAQRFQVISFARIDGVATATILDLKTEEREKVKEGDKLDDCEVWLVDMTKRIVKMYGPNLDSITLKLKRISN